MSQVFLTMQNLTKYFGSVRAIEDISFQNTSNAVGVLGANGAGKSTLFKLILGLISPSSGELNFVFSLNEIRVVPENPKLPKNLRVHQWHKLLKKTYGEPNSDTFPYEILDLDPNAYLGNLSAGQHKKASLLPIFYGIPKLLLIDEPTNYLDIGSRRKILQLIVDLLMRFKIKLLVSSHRLDEIKLLADEVLLMKDGRNIGVVNLGDNTIVSIVMRSRDKRIERILENQGIKFQSSKVIESYEYVVDYNDKSLQILKILMDQEIKINYLGFIDKFDEMVEGVFYE